MSLSHSNWIECTYQIRRMVQVFQIAEVIKIVITTGKFSHFKFCDDRVSVKGNGLLMARTTCIAM